MNRDQLIQGALGVACVVCAVVFLSDPKLLAAYTLISGYGFGLLGRLMPGPNQMTVQAANRLAEDRVAAALSEPPPRG